jgi:phosphocarrier protein HPr
MGYNLDLEDLQKGNLPEGAVTREFIVPNKLGLHARPAALLVKATRSYDSEIFIEKDGAIVDGKSIMGVMMLGAGLGSKLRFIALGDDADKLLDSIAELFETRFEEE